MKRKKSVSYEEGLFARLKDPEYATQYLNAQFLENDEHSIESFLLALRDVVNAHGFAQLSKKADIGRESLYKTLSKTGNPKLTTLAQLLDSIGLKIAVEPKIEKKKKAS